MSTKLQLISKACEEISKNKLQLRRSIYLERGQKYEW